MAWVETDHWRVRTWAVMQRLRKKGEESEEQEGGESEPTWNECEEERGEEQRARRKEGEEQGESE